jgi:hypothetical protein
MARLVSLAVPRSWPQIAPGWTRRPAAPSRLTIWRMYRVHRPARLAMVAAGPVAWHRHRCCLPS